jgi:threonine aldolase
VWRQRLGGGIRDARPLALAALAGLDGVLERMPAYRDHAVAIAAAVKASGVATVVPDPPQTPLFHVHLAAPRTAVERAGAELLEERGVQLYLRVRSSTDPNRCSFEITVGEPALEFEPAEVVELLQDLMKRAV